MRVEKLGDLKESNSLPPSKQDLKLLITNDHLFVRRTLKARANVLDKATHNV